MKEETEAQEKQWIKKKGRVSTVCKPSTEIQNILPCDNENEGYQCNAGLSHKRKMVSPCTSWKLQE